MGIFVFLRKCVSTTLRYTLAKWSNSATEVVSRCLLHRYYFTHSSYWLLPGVADSETGVLCRFHFGLHAVCLLFVTLLACLSAYLLTWLFVDCWFVFDFLFVCCAVSLFACLFVCLFVGNSNTKRNWKILINENLKML